MRTVARSVARNTACTPRILPPRGPEPSHTNGAASATQARPYRAPTEPRYSAVPIHRMAAKRVQAHTARRYPTPHSSVI